MVQRNLDDGRDREEHGLQTLKIPKERPDMIKTRQQSSGSLVHLNANPHNNSRLRAQWILPLKSSRL